MSQAFNQQHVGLPKNQPFNINGSRCQSKKNSWWNPESKNYWRNAKKSKAA